MKFSVYIVYLFSLLRWGFAKRIVGVWQPGGILLGFEFEFSASHRHRHPTYTFPCGTAFTTGTMNWMTSGRYTVMASLWNFAGVAFPVGVDYDVVASGCGNATFCSSIFFCISTPVGPTRGNACSSEPGVNPLRCTGAFAVRLEPTMRSSIRTGILVLVISVQTTAPTAFARRTAPCSSFINHSGLHNFQANR